MQKRASSNSSNTRSKVGSRTPKVRPRRDFSGMRRRRMRAARMFEVGQAPAAVAQALGVSCQAACNWIEQWLSGGSAALKGAGRAGRIPRLTVAQMKAVEKVLLKGARANGYATDLWTLERVAQVIERETGVSYHPGHVWRLLKALGWSRQKPARRAAERDEAAIQDWVKGTWEEVKKTPESNGAGSSSRTSRVSPSPPPSAAPGLPEVRPRSSPTGSGGSGSRRARPSATAGTASAPASTSRPSRARTTKKA